MAYEAGLKPDEFWSLTLREFSLYIEAYSRRMRQEHEQSMIAAWLTAKLGRAKRIPTLNRLLRFKDEATPLSPEEAARELERHKDLVDRLAPDATATPEQLREFTDRQNREFQAKIHGQSPEKLEEDSD